MQTYNQNNNDFVNDCTIYTIHQILKLQYGIDFKYSFINKTVDYFYSIGILLIGGAVFSTMYNSYINKANAKLGLKLIVDEQSLYSSDFETGLNDGEFYGLRLIHGNSTYLEAIEKRSLTKEDIDNIAEQGGGFKHNNCYGKNTLYEVARGYEVSIDYETLIYGVNKGVFGSIGRTILGDEEEEDKFTIQVGEVLKKWKADENYDPKNEYSEEIMNKAADIILFYEIR